MPALAPPAAEWMGRSLFNCLRRAFRQAGVRTPIALAGQWSDLDADMRRAWTDGAAAARAASADEAPAAAFTTVAEWMWTRQRFAEQPDLVRRCWGQAIRWTIANPRDGLIPIAGSLDDIVFKRIGRVNARWSYRIEVAGEEAGTAYRERDGYGWRIDCDLTHPDWTTPLTFSGSPQRDAWAGARSYLYHHIFGPKEND